MSTGATSTLNLQEQEEFRHLQSRKTPSRQAMPFFQRNIRCSRSVNPANNKSTGEPSFSKFARTDAGSDSFIASDTVLAETIKNRFSRGLTVENRGVQLHRYGSCWPLLEPACQTLVSSVTRMAAVNAARHIDSGVLFEHVPELPALLSAANRR
jgi:hypothetical protein